MGLMLHIFRKDVRRLWRESVASLALLAALTYLDSHRNDALCGPMEGALNLLLPLAWAYLVTLLIHEEAPAGDRQFWITRPYPWRALAEAKALFAIAFIHLPFFVADVAIIAARGFNPVESIGALVWKQILLAAALTIPVAALAALTRNLAQSILAAVVIAGAGVLLVGAVEPEWAPWIPVDETRRGIPWAMLSLAGAAIAWQQYAKRRTAELRVFAVSTVLAGAAVFAYMPREYSYRIACALSTDRGAHPALSIQVETDAPPPKAGYARSPANLTRLAIPVRISGIDPSASVRLTQLKLEITEPRGEHWAAIEQPRRNRQESGISLRTADAGWQYVGLNRAFYERVKGRKVRVTGEMGVDIRRDRNIVRMPVAQNGRGVPGIGRCFSVLVTDGAEGDMLKVVCESPRIHPYSCQCNWWNLQAEGYGNSDWGIVGRLYGIRRRPGCRPYTDSKRSFTCPSKRVWAPHSGWFPKACYRTPTSF